MKSIVMFQSEASLEAPPQARDGELAEGMLQEFAAFLAARPGLRAQHVQVSVGRETRGYVLQDAAVTPKQAASALEVAR